MQKIERKIHILDATHQSLGRLATQIAIFLMGKHRVDFFPNKDVGDFVEVLHVGQMKVTGKKMDQKIYRHHSGYPGGLKETPMKQIFGKNPAKVLQQAVSRMLPKNSHRVPRLKRLICK